MGTGMMDELDRDRLDLFGRGVSLRVGAMLEFQGEMLLEVLAKARVCAPCGPQTDLLGDGP